MLGENICRLRKLKNLSQEQLGALVLVTRQTISNWELNETSPNTDQLKLLSKALEISVDELIENDIKNVLVKKFEQTEKKTNKVFKLLLVTSVIFILIFIIEIVAITFYGLGYKKVKTSSTIYMRCELDDQKYLYDVSYYNNNLNVFQMGGSSYILENVIKENDYIGTSVINVITDINTYFKSNGGSCK